ncbi:hypothetical protein Dgeo_3083 (plasmid) [Deinococcus geothermalis DSM 11300]|uniref:Uncharacterized protein n=1 Tax=Deinococcus geothermalis (strain DSM 11300 / CIP 105573 / AG-3a) TaxID=319795 RepID=A8ZRL5_DEIGD|nr:hypothetical protein [Deinococcus geothermalis]ABW35124.1 hypothetical protein Dgeo_3083 [Deinococcus geothermalis DSM 11300]
MSLSPRARTLHFQPGTGQVLGAGRGLTLHPGLPTCPSFLVLPTRGRFVSRIELRPGTVRFIRPLCVPGFGGARVWRFFRLTGRWEVNP